MTSPGFFLVAGEASGDILGARLIASLKSIYPNASFKGIGGELMQAEGLHSLFAMDRLSIMGVVPILKRLPELLKMRRQLAAMIIQAKPDCFIGIDAPEFNLGLEYRLKRSGITTVHYVSPSVWAWREKRIFKIARSVDLMLCLFPFEQDIYHRHQVPVICIGHPLANEIPLQPDPEPARQALGLSADKPLVALMPGSRGSEIKYLLKPMLDAASLMKTENPQLEFVLPCANPKRRAEIEVALAHEPVQLPLKLVNGQSRLVMQAADAVLLASGTATLEALLLKKPMVVVYKMSGLSFWIFKKLLKISQYSLPNLLAGRALVKELIQDDCQPQSMARAILDLLRQDVNEVTGEYTRLHQGLMLGGSQKAAEAITRLLSAKNQAIKELTDAK